jgi:hypothetical protein
MLNIMQLSPFCEYNNLPMPTKLCARGSVAGFIKQRPPDHRAFDTVGFDQLLFSR